MMHYSKKNIPILRADFIQFRPRVEEEYTQLKWKFMTNLAMFDIVNIDT
jgi:hypothetical protein